MRTVLDRARAIATSDSNVTYPSRGAAQYVRNTMVELLEQDFLTWKVMQVAIEEDQSFWKKQDSFYKFSVPVLMRREDNGVVAIGTLEWHHGGPQGQFTERWGWTHYARLKGLVD